MRLSFYDQTPNTAAAILGAASVAFVLLFPQETRRIWTRVVFAVVWAGCGLALCLTQSRGAALALGCVAAVLGLFTLARPSFRRAAIFLIVTSCAVWTWAGLHGRVTPASLGHSAGMRADFAKAALMRAAESRFHGMAPAPGFAEDAALRHGTPVSAAQRDIIRNPLSSLLNLAAGPGPLAALTWLAWLAPAFCLVSAALFKSRLIAASAGSGEGVERPGVWTIPAICLFTAICAVFNDLHQNVGGRWLIWTSAGSGAAWLVFHVARSRFRLVGGGLAGAAMLHLFVLIGGEWCLRENQARQGVRRWAQEERPLAGRASLRVVEGGVPLMGTLVVFDYLGRGERAWAARKSAYRLVGQGWRLLEVRGRAEAGREIREACVADGPLIAVGVEGPVPAGFALAMRPSAIVSVSPSRLVLVSDDGGDAATRRYWLFGNESEAGEALRLLRRALVRTESDTEIVVLGPDLAISMKSSLGRVAENHRRAAGQSRNFLNPASFP